MTSNIDTSNMVTMTNDMITSNMVTSNMGTSNMMTSPCISSSNLDVTFFSTPSSISNSGSAHFISSTSSSNNSFASMFALDPILVQSDLIGLTNVSDVGCPEVSSSSPLPLDLEGLEPLSDHHLMQGSMVVESSLSPTDTLDSTCITLASLRPHSAYSDVSSLSCEYYTGSCQIIPYIILSYL